MPTLEDAAAILRVLARSATGQEMSVYTTISTGPRRSAISTAEQYHVVLLDSGRNRMLGSEFREALRCIRCGACLNHCRSITPSAATPMAGSTLAPLARC